MPEAPVVLVSMPWDSLYLPSIQLGILKALLRSAGIPVQTRSYTIDWAQWLIEATAGENGSSLHVADYQQVALERYDLGLGDWIFAVPFLRAESDLDGKYLEYLGEHGVPDSELAKAQRMRKLVPGFLERCAEELASLEPSVVGFTSSFSQTPASLSLARLVKERQPTIPIVFGGANCDGDMGRALHESYPWVDFVVRGEGEPALVKFMRQLIAGERVTPFPGLCARGEDGGTIVCPGAGMVLDMDDVPRPDYDEYFARLEGSPRVRAEVKPALRLPFESSRGCWWGEKSHCTFCGLNGTSMSYRAKSATKVEDELRELSARYRQVDFNAVDNIIAQEYFKTLLPALSENRLDYTFFYEVKSNLSLQQLRLLRNAGVLVLQPGIESLSTPILKRMGKGVTAFQNVRLLKWAAEFGLLIRWNLLYGFPGEKASEYRAMQEELTALTHLPAPALVRLHLDRFSPYYEKAGQFGVEITGPKAYYQYIYDQPPEQVARFAYSFEYSCETDGDPEAYVQGIRDFLPVWETGGSLSYRRGQGFIVIEDRRPNKEAKNYELEGPSAQIYEACAKGASAKSIHRKLGEGDAGLELPEIEDFLADLHEKALVYAEGGRYLALATRSPSAGDNR